MIADLKPYSAIKGSGVPWLGEVPEHWEIRRGKTLFRCIDVRSETGEEELLTVSSERGVVPRHTANVTMFKAESYLGYKLCWPGDLVINSLWAWARGLGISRYHGIVSSAYGVYRLRNESENHPSFIHELVRSTPFHWELRVRSKGVWTSRLQLTDESFLEAPFPVPPREEQLAIVRFLDHYDRKIRRYIRVKQKLIKLLEEEKQAIIHRAVTRGLDPNVRLKPSGVEWLGNVPEHWGFNRGKSYFRELDVRSTTGIEELLSVSHITGVTPRSQKNINMFKAESYVGSKLCKPGQIAVNTMWAWMAAIGVSKYHGVISPSYHIYEQINAHSYQNEFLDLLLRSTPYKNLYTVHSTGITSSRLRLYPEDFLKIRFLCPPKNEQEAIVAWVGGATIDLNVVIDRTHREIDLLREYRTRLITDVVTGKLDVREAAAQLSEEPEELFEGGAKDFSPLQDDDNGLTDNDTEEDDLEIDLQETILAD